MEEKNHPESHPSEEIKAKEQSDKKKSAVYHRTRVVLDQELQMYHFSSIAVCSLLMVSTFFAILLFSGYTNLVQDWVALTAMMIMFSMAPAFGIHSILHSHRIAGPVHRLEKAMGEVLQGNYDYQVQLREKDYFKNLAEAFNEMNRTLKGKEETWKELQVRWEMLKQELPGEWKEKIHGLDSLFAELAKEKEKKALP